MTKTITEFEKRMNETNQPSNPINSKKLDLYSS